MDIAEFRRALHEWLDRHARDLAPPFAPPGTLDDHVAQMQRVKALLHEAGCATAGRSGWATLAAAGDAPDPRTAALAKATAGRAARTVAAHCQQVLAGIGFTTEHPFHRFLTRTIALDGLLGSPDEIAADLGRHLLATRRVPTLIEL